MEIHGTVAVAGRNVPMDGSVLWIPRTDGQCAVKVRDGNIIHGMYCHDLEIMSSNPGRVELGVPSTSAQSRT